MTAPLRPDPLLSAAVAWNYLASGVGLPPAHLAQQYPFKGASGWQGVDPTPGQVKACCWGKHTAPGQRGAAPPGRGGDLHAYSGNRGDAAPGRQACDQAELKACLLRRMTDT